MAKVKISKKSTRIDMTAMCDVAFLLLSFFIMSATAKQPEPKAVDVPASTVIEKLPEEGVAVITVGEKQVFFTIPRDIRVLTLEKMATLKGTSFTAEEKKKFEGMDGFGVPLSQLKALLKLENAERNTPGLQKGIPYDSVGNQLGDWVQQARYANREWLNERIAAGEENVKFRDLDIAIKGDAKENFTTVQQVIDILQDQKKNKFYLVTNLRGENF
ncbi:biopolymer transporter ExbD [Flavobacterium akiainvivens]|uniref:Biopolymer transporter ExbD n=1 Tax=Flavobacterium akiainvivens TaxID=1202724 RepID=A0A0M9VJA5_9FLAO|nr:biopolymer transporter ExbD [Flavobacterium akiainvivens]KOS07536.1 biopolymer transporter ExbD [Flavobacterium akiainvivens]SFQ64161.1 outer membrane transport energization protein ExbD [Flavobacterium akiainvivens]